MKAGGQRGAFDAAKAEHELIGLIALIPPVVDDRDRIFALPWRQNCILRGPKPCPKQRLKGP